MNKNIIIMLALFLLFLTSCGDTQTIYMCKDGSVGGGIIPEPSMDTIYYCPDGKQTKDLTTCKFVRPAVIQKKDAETAALAYVKGYVASEGWLVSLINVYQEEDWKAQLIISKRDEGGYETIVNIDGTTGVVRCQENCAYVGG